MLINQVSDLIKAYQKALAEIKGKIAKMYENYGDKVQLSDMMVYNRLTNLEAEITTIISDLSRYGISSIRTGIKNTFSESYYKEAFLIEKTVGVKLGFGILNPKVIEAAITNPLDRIKWEDRFKDNIKKFTQNIREEITQGLIQGKGYGKMATAIQQKTEMSAYRAMRIARTEAHRAQSMGKLASMERAELAAEKLGIKIQKVWTATLDDKTRDTHGRIDGQVADENGMFTLPSGVKTAGPGLSGIPSEDINCRCTVVTRVDGQIPESRKDNSTKQVIEYKTYSEWKKARL